jgi:intracellular sulfur oxidation DsrE/DsrF family protein
MTPRRSFLTRFGVAAAAFGLGNAHAIAAQDSTARWQPAREARDDWFDQVPGKHRIFFDVLTVQGTSDAQGFAGNYFDASKSGYGLEATEVAVVICLRHMSTPLAFGDAFWTKYGAVLGEAIKLNDPKTAQPSIVNTHRAALETLARRGVHFAVCDMASHRFAGMVARRTDGDADAVYKEMTASVTGNSHFVPAGIVAVNRAQEHGYSIAYVG